MHAFLTRRNIIIIKLKELQFKIQNKCENSAELLVPGPGPIANHWQLHIFHARNLMPSFMEPSLSQK